MQILRFKCKYIEIFCNFFNLTLQDSKLLRFLIQHVTVPCWSIYAFTVKQVHRPNSPHYFLINNRVKK